MSKSFFYKWLGYFALFAGIGIVTISMGWIAGYQGLTTVLYLSFVPFLLAALIAQFIAVAQDNDVEKRALKSTLQLRTGQLQDANQTIKRMATKDILTGLYNRRGFKSLLKREMIRCKRLKTQLVVLVIHFNHMTSDNAANNHSMMSLFGKHLKKWIRGTDVPARVSDSSMAFLLLDTNEEGANRFLERLKEHLSQSEFTFPEFSVGMSVFPDQNLSSTDDLLETAINKAVNPQK